MSDNPVLGASYDIKHVIIISVFSGLASVAVVLRVWARRMQKMSLELNDYLVIFGLLCGLGETSVNIYGCCFGMVKQMSQKEMMKALIFSQKSAFMSIIIWVASVTFIRASIVFLYIRLFPTRIFRRVCHIVLVANFCFFTSTVLADCLICQPISYRWDRMTGGKGFCGSQKPLDLYIGISNLILDVTAVALPMPVLWGLKMNLGKKVMLSGMFGMGIITCAVTAYRIYVSATISASNAQEAYAVVALLASLETLLGVISASLPVLKPIFNKLRGTAPKSGGRSDVKEILKSGTIPIFMRVSQMFSFTSRRGRNFSSDGETLAETPAAYEEKNDKTKNRNGKADAEDGKGATVVTREISSPMTDKAERLLGIKAQEIHVRRNVDVESLVSRDEKDLVYEGWDGRQEKW